MILYPEIIKIYPSIGDRQLPIFETNMVYHRGLMIQDKGGSK